ncbi:hypothetical protein LZ31DRAFT_50107 [Colletotrichum somersetense]|nr:hypothetical protein LZ31DRAFT_50107 [Colletotrichum somersetense]
MDHQARPFHFRKFNKRRRLPRKPLAPGKPGCPTRHMASKSVGPELVDGWHGVARDGIHPVWNAAGWILLAVADNLGATSMTSVTIIITALHADLPDLREDYSVADGGSPNNALRFEMLESEHNLDSGQQKTASHTVFDRSNASGCILIVA